jgi:hypothetical protein
VKLVLVKQTDAQIEPGTPDADALRRFLFENIDGATDKDKSAWRRFVKAMNTAQAGDYFTIDLKRQRNEKFHKLVFAVILAGFRAQEHFMDIEVYRQWIKLGAGFAVFIPDEKTGELKAIPKSQSFDESSEEEVRQFFDDMCAFMRSATYSATLWPHAPIEGSMLAMENLLRRFDSN